MKNDVISHESLKAQYNVEKELANRLRHSNPEERLRSYASIYEELFRRVPHHQLLKKNAVPDTSVKKLALQIRNIRPFLRKNSIFLEIGAGDCAVSKQAAALVKMALATDVTPANVSLSNSPDNFLFFQSDGCNIPLTPNTVDCVYSCQVMEHLHPDDALAQAKSIYDVLKLGGIYMCDTPNRLSGPHDVSQYFDVVASGLHLKEYTTSEVGNLFSSVGFSRIRVYIRIKSVVILSPIFPFSLAEYLIERLPITIRRKLSRRFLVRFLLGIRVIASK